MSDTQVVMNFEFLPNEILIECFEYLNAFEIFYSLDGLNDRFTQLILTIPLYLNFQHVRKSTFDQFCTQMKLHPEIKNQIYSLHLSDEDSCGQTEVFLSLFSINEFLHLRSLTLVHLADSNIEKLKTKLPLLSELRTFHIIQPGNREMELLPVVPMTKLRILSIPEVSPSLTSDNEILSIRSLTVSNCSLVDLIKILKYMPMLKYLQIQHSYVQYKPRTATEDVDDYHAVHLKRLIIDDFESEFTDLELLVKKTPNLTNLTIYSNSKNHVSDAGRWECLIRSSLPNLITFNFALEFNIGPAFVSMYYYNDWNEHNASAAKFKQFQASFWREEHRWYIEYALSIDCVHVYTIPFISKTFSLTSNIETYSDGLTNNSNRFDNVTDLTVDVDMIAENDGYYFSNVTSLVIVDDSLSSYYPNTTSKRDYIENLKTIVNLSNLKHVSFSSSSLMVSSTVLLQLLKEAQQLSSMTIDKVTLISLFDDVELCKYLNNMIKKLDLSRGNHYSYGISQKLMDFCKIFSNLEQLTCDIDKSDDVLYLVNHLSKLSLLTVNTMTDNNSKNYFSRFENQATNQNIIYRFEYKTLCGQLYVKALRIWCG